MEDAAQFCATPSRVVVRTPHQTKGERNIRARPRLTFEPFCANAGSPVRKLIAFDDDTFDKLKQLARDRMATIQELADEAFADVLKKHGVPIDLKDALRKSAAGAKPKTDAKSNAGAKHRAGSVRKTRS